VAARILSVAESFCALKSNPAGCTVAVTIETPCDGMVREPVTDVELPMNSEGKAIV